MRLCLIATISIALFAACSPTTQTTNNDNIRDLLRRAAQQRRGKNYENALDLYDQAIEQIPQNASAYVQRGLTYLNMQDYENADDDFLHALTLQPEHANANFWLGVLWLEQGISTQAIEHFTQAILHNPNNPNYYQERARAYEQQGDLHTALRDYNQYIALARETDPDFDMIWEHVQVLEAQINP